MPIIRTSGAFHESTSDDMLLRRRLFCCYRRQLAGTDLGILPLFHAMTLTSNLEVHDTYGIYESLGCWQFDATIHRGHEWACYLGGTKS